MKALLIVDVQNDFCPGGALAVPRGDEVVPVINRLQPHFDLVVATQDWHPPHHGSFAANHPGRRPGEQIVLAGLAQILWPVHCVQDSPGAEFHPQLDRARIARVIRKGTSPTVDSYSGFFDNGRRASTGLDRFLADAGVDEVFVCGLATDYCVKATALDAVDLGFATRLLPEACRGVELQPGDVSRAMGQMQDRGVRLVPAADLLGR